MAHRIGLKIFDPLEIIERDRLRRDLLLVDKIAIDDQQLKLAKLYAETLCKIHDKDTGDLVGRFENDLAFLESRGLLQHVSVRDASVPEGLQIRIETIERNADRQLQKNQPYRVSLPDGTAKIIDPLGSYVLNKTIADFHRARCLATQITRPDCQVLPLASGPIASLFGQGDRQAKVLRVVLSNIPIPARDTPLEDIITFRSDSDAKTKLARLHSWMVDMAVSNLSEEQIQTKLESLLGDYRDSLKHHRIKTELNNFQIVVVTTAEILENVVQLKFSEVAKKVFQLFKEDCSLIDAERGSPGRELAFIDSASAFFQK